MAGGEQPLDWATADSALASIAAGGIPRSALGPGFAARHVQPAARRAARRSEDQTYHATADIWSEQAEVEILNSPLSEAGVLGFEYGYSLVFPDGLVIWEAQFGDFANTAQVIIDQFIASSEDKWRHLSGLVMLLPHGFEGQGPEHSSARLERFLNLAAEDNMQIVVPTTPAQHFHCSGGRSSGPGGSPWSCSRPRACCGTRERSRRWRISRKRTFQRVLPDTTVKGDAYDRVLLCSGKIYYELLEARRRQQREDIAIVRSEQLYPFADASLAAAMESYPDGTPVYWVQEEPENMGAWYFLRVRNGEVC